MKKITLTMALMGLVLLAFAHEFWLQPSRFFVKPGESIKVQTLVGENFKGERSEGKKNRIVFYKHFSSAGTADLSPSLQDDHYGDVSVPINQPGTHLVAFTNTSKFIELTPDKFIAYLKEDGLDNVIKARQEQGSTQKNGREMYRRCVKTLIQSGTKADDTYALNTGLPLEIIPVQNPYTSQSGQVIEFQLLFENKPLVGALVRYWNRNKNQLSTDKQRSNAEGRVKFRIKQGGNMVSVVNMVPYENPTEADWQSYWGSLTFGCR